MASESTSSQQSSQLIPSSKVNFKCEEGTIAFNNAIALLEHSNELNFGIQQKWKKKPTSPPSYFHGANPLSFIQKEFTSATSLPICENLVPLPPKETVRAGLATLGLFDKDKPTLSSTELVNSSPLKIKYFSPIGNCSCNILDKYISNDLNLVKPHTITAASFQKPLASEVLLTSHMLKVAKLFVGPEQSLIPPPGEVNADDTADKSPSKTTM
ncbi:hypothetical protein Tco_0825166 [Tanacetum coccineum]